MYNIICKASLRACSSTVPTTNGDTQNGSSVGIFAHCIGYMFLHVWHRFVC